MRAHPQAHLTAPPRERAPATAATGLRPLVGFVLAAFVFTVPFEDALTVPTIGSLRSEERRVGKEC